MLNIPTPFFSVFPSAVSARFALLEASEVIGVFVLSAAIAMLCRHVSFYLYQHFVNQFLNAES